jgi:hypothetical protein
MFEAIYISPSCKQAVNFINDLAAKLKQRGIDGFDIDCKNIQLKSDKFIVSAVDIFGRKLGLSHHMTEYYIDVVSDSVFPRCNRKTCALERLKELKCTFREGAKQISEEELIEILTEVSE